MRRFLFSLAVTAAAGALCWFFMLRPRAAVTAPAPAALTIYFTCDTSGRIEPCGCFTGQYGGLTRVSSVLRTAAPDSLRLEIGNALAGTEDYHLLQFRHLLAAEGKLGYQACNLGSREASLPADTLRRLARESPVPLISANVLDAGTREPVVQPWRMVEAGGLKIGIIGVTGTDKPAAHASVVIEAPADALRRLLPELRAKTDVIVCMAFADEAGLEDLARKFYEIPVILGGDVHQPSQSLVHINQSSILATTNQSRALGRFQANWNPDKRILEAADGSISLMHDKIQEDAAIAAFSRAYRREVRTAPLAVDHPGESDDSVPGVKPAAEFTGSKACASCHAGAFAAWEKSGHSHAFQSLVSRESDADPSCIGCHTVGFGEPGGYRRGMKADHLINVGCESCHGPGSEHIKARSATLTTNEPVLYKMRPVGPGQCTQCHHGEFSRPFRYEDFWPAIIHGKEPQPR